MSSGVRWMMAQRIGGGAASLVLYGGTLAAAAALFYFRLRLRSVYGVTEAMAGLAVAGQRAPTEFVLGDGTFYFAVLTAGVYLVVRGFDNIHQGLTKEPFDPLATWVVRRFREFRSPTRR
jgi:hypothetical protein